MKLHHQKKIIIKPFQDVACGCLGNVAYVLDF